jgi:protein phosphatase
MAQPDTSPEIPVLSLEEAPPAHAAGPLHVRSFGLTDPGRVRSNNEDQFLIATLTRALQVEQTSLPRADMRFSPPRGHLFVVADGVGGHAAGEKASALAVSLIEEFVVSSLQWCLQLRGVAEDQVLKGFRTALEQVDERLFHEAERRPELRGMATTLTLAYCRDAELFVAHAGDSRCYLQRDGLFQRLTRDHTLVGELVREGLLDAESAAHHRLRHVVTNVVGGSEEGVEAEVHHLTLQGGDALLLCSDGLTEMVSESDALDVMQSHDDPEACCRRLVDMANDQGGRDNVTVVVARFDG